ncbi:MAG: hypothetical protein ACOCSD_00930 [Halolamina sp.]
MVRNFNEMDEGKRVVTADGEEVGTVTSATGSRLHVSPADDLSRSIRRRLGWSEDEDSYELQKDHVDEITDDEVRLTQD